MDEQKQEWARVNGAALKAANASIVDLLQYLNKITPPETIYPISARLRDLLSDIDESGFDEGVLSGHYRRSADKFALACSAIEHGDNRAAGKALQKAVEEYQLASALLADQPPPEKPRVPIHHQGVFWVAVILVVTVLFMLF